MGYDYDFCNKRASSAQFEGSQLDGQVLLTIIQTLRLEGVALS